MSGNMFTIETSPVSKEDIWSIFKVIDKEIVSDIFDSSEGHLIGSWKKKEMSGDIDILVFTDAETNVILDRLAKKNYEARFIRGLNILSVLYPYNDTYIQIDFFLIPTDTNRQIAKLFYFTEDEEEYSHKHRLFLCFAILDNIKENIIMDGHVIKQYTGYMLRPDGIYKFRKQLKRVRYAIVKKEFITNDIEEIAEYITGEKLQYSKWNTFKKILNIIKKRLDEDKLKDIFTSAVNIFDKFGLEPPFELVHKVIRDIK